MSVRTLVMLASMLAVSAHVAAQSPLRLATSIAAQSQNSGQQPTPTPTPTPRPTPTPKPTPAPKPTPKPKAAPPPKPKAAPAKPATPRPTSSATPENRPEKPEAPPPAEYLFPRMDDGRLPIVPTAHGFYPAVGTVYPGSKLAFGGGWRQDHGPGSFVDGKAMWSIANYKRAEVTGVSAHHFEDRVDFGGRIGWLDAPRLPFFGLGPDSDEDARASFRLKETYVEGAAIVRPAPWVLARAGVGYDAFVEDTGRGSHPPVDTRFTPLTAPHLAESPAFVTLTGSATFLWLASPGYSRDGGLYRIGYQSYSRTDGGGETFGILRNEIAQHLPLREGRAVLSVRARTESAIVGADQVPFFLLPSLGGGNTLRGYYTDRFRDVHSLLFTGEWRWLIKPKFLDVAVFSDAGTVGPHLSSLGFQHMSVDYGFGVRLHSKVATILRMDVVHGSEGFGLVFTTAPPF
ncbi:MAG: hypothetical protein ABI652_01425 [Acidobacteriota bacterium]